MCYQITERYSVCRCLYYQHPVDMCAAYGQYGHNIQEKTVLVGGYPCSIHSSYGSETEPTSNQEGFPQSTNSVPISPKPSAVITSKKDTKQKFQEKDKVRIKGQAISVTYTIKWAGQNRETKLWMYEVEDRNGDIYKGSRAQNGFVAQADLKAEEEFGKQKHISNQPSQIPLPPVPLRSTDSRTIIELQEISKSNAAGSEDSESDDSQNACRTKYTPDCSLTPTSAGCSLSPRKSDAPNSMASIVSDFTARVRNPAAYLDRLQDLETTVFESSTAEIYFPSTELGYGNANKSQLLADYPDLHIMKNFEAPISDAEALAIIRRKSVKRGNDLGSILESRNVLAKAVANIYSLQDAGFCGSHISILAADDSRENVIRLVPVHFKDIVALLSQFEDYLRKVLIVPFPSQHNIETWKKIPQDMVVADIAAPKSEGEKRKVQEKTVKDDDNNEDPSNKERRPKETWTKIPFTPTAVFNTPIPTRGGGPTSASHSQSMNFPMQASMSAQEEVDYRSAPIYPNPYPQPQLQTQMPPTGFTPLPSEEKKSTSKELDPVTDLIDACVETLQLVLPISCTDVLEWQYIATIRLTVHLVDLAVLSYAGAHVNDFGKHCALETPRIFDLLNPFSGTLFQTDENRPFLDEYFAGEEVISIQMQQCHLLCLDAFHDNQPVWIFSSCQILVM